MKKHKCKWLCGLKKSGIIIIFSVRNAVLRAAKAKLAVVAVEAEWVASEEATVWMPVEVVPVWKISELFSHFCVLEL